MHAIENALESVAIDVFCWAAVFVVYVPLAFGVQTLAENCHFRKPRLRETAARASLGLYRAKSQLRVARASMQIRANAMAVQQQMLRDLAGLEREGPNHD